MIALFAGSFHPPTLGHMDIIARSARMFDKVYVAVMANANKTYMLSAAERVEMLKRCARGMSNVEIVTGGGLTAEFARSLGAGVLVRGVRGAADLEYEMQAAQANRMLTGIDTAFLPALSAHGYISSSLVNDVARHGGAIDQMVPEEIAEDIRRAIARDSKGV